jgi:hypothetical protein
MHYTVERDKSGITVIARRETRDAGVLPAAVLEPTGAALAFSERAPGWFEARLPASLDAEVRLLAGAAGPRTRLVSMPGDIIASEKQVDPAATLDLDRLAELTGANSAANDARRSLDLVTLWPWLLALALLVYLSELIYRRRSRS